MQKAIVEAIGTFFLVTIIGLVVGLGHAGTLAPLAIGGGLMVLIFAGGHVSGAHYNPVVTVAAWLRGAFPASGIALYIAAQLVGAVLGALTVSFLAVDAVFDVGSFSTTHLVIAEILFTFLLCWVILNVATAKATEGNGFYGLAIGFTVTAGAYAVGPISSAVFNPAVAVALCVLGLLPWTALPIYCIAQFVGGAAAAAVFKATVTDADEG